MVPVVRTPEQRAYARAHYLANRSVYLARARAKNKAQKSRNREMILAAKAVACADCGIQYPFYVMQFDHVQGEKLFEIGSYSNIGYLTDAKLLAEIEKCEVVCANCHATRTWERNNASVAQLAERPTFNR